ncbi:MAG: fibronectin type III domain-containing protein [Nitrosopumilus sp.]|nr:fibronectin type III domain-containing protein [Nitrosopumilus sp.]
MRYHGTTGQPLGVSGIPGDALFANVGIDNPAGLLFSQDDTYLLVANFADNTIVKIDALTGNFVEVFGDATATTGLSTPEKMAWGPDGHLYASSSNNQILRYHGTTGQALGISGISGDAVFSSNDDLDDPQGIAWGPDGNLYAGNDDHNDVVKIDGITGASLGQFNEEISGLVDDPSAIVFDSVGDLYVVNEDDHDVVLFKGPLPVGTAGQFDRTVISVDFVVNQAPWDLAFGPKPASLPGQILDLSAIAISSSQIDLAWSAPSDGGLPIVGYLIERQSDSESVFSTLIANTGPVATSYSDLGLTGSTQYDYRVYAINTGGTAPVASNVAFAVTTSSNTPPAITTS